MATPVRLGCVNGHIWAAGPDKFLKSLAFAAEALPVWSHDGRDRGVILPATRVNFLAVEAAAAPEWVSPEYRAARTQAVLPPAFAIEAAAELAEEHGARPLLPHQHQFLAFAMHQKGAINASEQGTGKTRAALAAMRIAGPRRALVVCPKSLVLQWAEEWHSMWRDDDRSHWAWSVQTLGEGTLAQRRKWIAAAAAETGRRHLLILNYEMLGTLLRDLLAFAPEMVMFDESWKVKNRSAQVTKAALKLAAAVHAQEGRVMLLTGTPIGNDIGDLWSQICLLGAEERLGDYWSFMRRFATMALVDLGPRKIWKPTGVADPAALIERVEPYWFRATKETCLDLPPKIYRKVVLDLPDDLQSLYRQVREFGSSALGATLNLDGAQTTLIRLQQIAGGTLPVPTDERGREWTTQEVASPKIDWLKEFAADRLAGNPSCRALVWCRFLAEGERLQRELTAILGDRVAFVSGDTKTADLERLKASYNSRDADGIQVLVCQIAKMAYGHNLQATDFSIHYSHTWSYVERAQAEDRAHRHGRSGAVQYVDLIAAGTIDEEIARAMARKQDLARRLSPETAVSDDLAAEYKSDGGNLVCQG